MKVRIKTEDEIKDDDKWDYELGTPVGWNYEKHMNKFMGEEIEIEEDGWYKLTKRERDKIKKKYGKGVTHWYFEREYYHILRNEELENKEKDDELLWSI